METSRFSETVRFFRFRPMARTKIVKQDRKNAARKTGASVEKRKPRKRDAAAALGPHKVLLAVQHEADCTDYYTLSGEKEVCDSICRALMKTYEERSKNELTSDNHVDLVKYLVEDSYREDPGNMERTMPTLVVPYEFHEECARNKRPWESNACACYFDSKWPANYTVTSFKNENFCFYESGSKHDAVMLCSAFN